MRLDQYLSKNYNIQSRNKASELIKGQKVLVNGKTVKKPSYTVLESDDIKIDQEEFFVSRSAYKLKYFLEQLSINLKNSNAIDIGSSTGGFTQVLLQSNVSSVTCVDVGSNQLHESIKDDKRIIIQENTDIRIFKPLQTYEVVTCDVSFISILKILDDINRLALDKIIILYKPQYEVGKDIKRDRSGVVQDHDAIKKERDNFLETTKKYGWRFHCSSLSKVAGKNGNVEELFYFTV